MEHRLETRVGLAQVMRPARQLDSVHQRWRKPDETSLLLGQSCHIPQVPTEGHRLRRATGRYLVIVADGGIEGLPSRRVQDLPAIRKLDDPCATGTGELADDLSDAGSQFGRRLLELGEGLGEALRRIVGVAIGEARELFDPNDRGPPTE